MRGIFVITAAQELKNGQVRFIEEHGPMHSRVTNHHVVGTRVEGGLVSRKGFKMVAAQVVLEGPVAEQFSKTIRISAVDGGNNVGGRNADMEMGFDK